MSRPGRSGLSVPSAIHRGPLLALAVAAGALCPSGASEAQEDTTGRVVGRVVEAATLQPVSSALVGLEGEEFRTTTDAEGRFALGEVPAGPRVLVIQHLAYGRQAREVEVPAGGTVTVLLEVAPQAIPLDPIRVRATGGRKAPAHWARVVGRVLEGDSNRKGIGDVAIVFRPLGHHTFSDEEGRFGLALPPGTHVVEASHLAYGTETTSVRVPANRTLELTLRLSPDAIELEPLFVEVAMRSRHLERRGFYERRARGWGYFFDPEFFRRTPLVSSAWLEQLGERLPSGSRYCGGRRGLPATFYLDGHKISRAGLPPINVAEVAAVEWYPSPSQTAPEFIDSGSRCGVVVIWTKRDIP